MGGSAINIDFLNKTVEFLERQWQQLGQLAQERLFLNGKYLAKHDLCGNIHLPTVQYYMYMEYLLVVGYHIQ